MDFAVNNEITDLGDSAEKCKASNGTMVRDYRRDFVKHVEKRFAKAVEDEEDNTRKVLLSSEIGEWEKKCRGEVEAKGTNESVLEQEKGVEEGGREVAVWDGFCYNTTCSTSWLVVSQLIPLGESEDDALRRTPPPSTACGRRVTICFASLGDSRSQSRSEVVWPADRPGPPSGFRLRSEAVPNVYVVSTPETRSYALHVIRSKLDRASRLLPTCSHDETHSTKPAYMHRPSTLAPRLIP